MTEKLDEFHAHEALHTAHLMLNIYTDHLQGHPYIEANPKLVREAEKVFKALYDLYQLLGAVTLDEPKPKP